MLEKGIMDPSPRLISTRAEEFINRILSAFDDAVELRFIVLRLNKIRLSISQ